MAHGHEMPELQDRFTQTSKLRKFVLGLIGGGLVLLILGIVMVAAGGGASHEGGAHDDHQEEHHEAGHDGAHSSVAKSTVPFQLVQNEGTHAAGEHGDEAHSAGEHAAEDHSEGAHAAGEHDEEAHAADGEAHGDAHDAHAAAGMAHGDDHAEGGHGGGHGHAMTGPLWLNRLLTSVTQHAFYFMGVSLLCVFFLAINYASNAGWYVVVERIAMAFTRFIPVGWLLLMLVWALNMAGVVHIYPWTDSERMANDPLLGSKDWFLNTGFFLVRQVFVVIIWMMFDLFLRRRSLAEDSIGGTELFRQRRVLSALFLVVFAFSWSLASYDWILALDAHFFSTMFGVHMFANTWVSALCLIAIVAGFLRYHGYLPQYNEAHMHDLGKYIFAFSIFWTYIWFSQFLLIWYANIPEETMFFKRILDNYPFLFALNLVINFILPLLALMTNTSKRRFQSLVPIAILVFVGKFVDLFLMTHPHTVGADGGIGFIEIGTYLVFLGLFLMIGFNALTKHSLVSKGHPYLKESVLHFY